MNNIVCSKTLMVCSWYTILCFQANFPATLSHTVACIPLLILLNWKTDKQWTEYRSELYTFFGIWFTWDVIRKWLPAPTTMCCQQNRVIFYVSLNQDCIISWSSQKGHDTLRKPFAPKRETLNLEHEQICKPFDIQYRTPHKYF